jgi:hypothetical protein
VKDEGDAENPSYLEPEDTKRYLNRQSAKSQTQSQRTRQTPNKKKTQPVSGLSPREKLLASRQQQEQEEQERPTAAALPQNFFELNQPLLLNIGGYLKKSGWVNINSQRSSFGSAEEPELVRELHDLQVCALLSLSLL